MNDTPFPGSPPPEWKDVSLGDVLEEVKVRADEVEGGVDLPVLSLTKDRGLIPQSERFNHRVARKDVSDYKVIRRGWIAYNPMVLWEGAIHALSQPSAGLISPVYAIWKALDVDPWYLDYLTKTTWMLGEYQRLASGVVKRRRTVKKTAFQNIRVPLPPLREQRAIADVLRTVQRAKEQTERVIAATKELKRSLRSDLFGYGPTALSSVTAQDRRDLELGRAPAHWELSSLGSLLREPLRNGHSAREARSGDGVRTLTLTAVTQNDFSPKNTKLTVANPEDVSDLWLEPGDILVERANTRKLVGLAALYDGERHYAIFPDLMIRVRVCEEQLKPEFLAEYLSLEACRSYFSRTASGTAGSMPKINQNLLRALVVPVPQMPEQEQIASSLTVLDAKIDAEKDRREALDELLKTLLKSLMTATIRVGQSKAPRTGE